jgi:GDPmannose 4,6-dehydratase
VIKSALICGISGQDGSLLAKLLLDKGYKVYGTSRDIQANKFDNLEKLSIRSKIKFYNMSPEDFKSVYVVIKDTKPNEIYFLAGQTSVGLSFELPSETMKSITIGTLNVLEASRLIDNNIKIYHAGSSESFGNTTKENPATEKTSFCPRSPYAVSKASATWLVSNYREAYNMYACTGILFNHDSNFRPIRFVTQKIIQTAKLISNGSNMKLNLGRLDISRDWGWADEYVNAMWLMLQLNKPEDFVIATGQTNTLLDFVKLTFNHFNLNWENYLIEDFTNYRPTDITNSYANPLHAKNVLGWEAKIFLPEIIERMAKY